MVEPRFLLHVLSVLQFLTMSHSTNKISDSCPTNARVNLTGNIPDSLGVVEKSGYVFPPESRWLQDDLVFGCFCYDKPCLPLCCPLETVLIDGACVLGDTSAYFTFPSIINSANLMADGIKTNVQNFHTVVSDPCDSEESYLLDPENHPEDVFHLMNNGSIYLPQSDSNKLRNIDDYCLWRSDNSSSYGPKVCLGNPSWSKLQIHIEIMIPIPFLLATLVVYTILPEMRNLHGKTMRGYLYSTLVAYTAVAVAQTNSSLPDYLCIFTAYTIQFSFFASFFWLNVMCFDIWWRLGRSKILSTNDKQSDRKKSIIYSIYGWGCPILFIGFGGIIDYLWGLPDDMLRPKLPGGKICWFQTDSDLARGLLFYVPFGITLLCNNFFFILTALKLKRDAEDVAQHLEGADSRRHSDNNQWFHLCLKLFITMGISVTLELLLWIFQYPKYLEIVTRVWRALRGLIIFVIFICKKTVIRQLIQYFGLRVPNFLSLNSNRGSHPSSRQPNSVTDTPST